MIEAQHFSRMAHEMLRVRGDGDKLHANVSKTFRSLPAHSHQVLIKAAVAAASTVGSGGLDYAQQTASAAFVESLRQDGVFDAMLPSMVNVPLGLPGLKLSTSAIIGSVTPEAAGRPVTRITIGDELLQRRRVDTILVVTKELADSLTPAARALIDAELRAGVVAATDGDFLLGLAGKAGVSQAGGTDVLAAVQAALSKMALSARSRLFLVLPSNIARKLRLDLAWDGGSLADISILGSDQIRAGSPGLMFGILVDASAVAGASDGVILDMARQATLQMVDSAVTQSSAAGSPPAPVASTGVNLWQTDSAAIRASRHFGFTVLRPKGVALITGVGGW